MLVRLTSNANGNVPLGRWTVGSRTHGEVELGAQHLCEVDANSCDMNCGLLSDDMSIGMSKRKTPYATNAWAHPRTAILARVTASVLVIK